jgi:hypothetical protein
MECWASILGNCAGGKSREHFISDGIFDGESITAFGLPWCKDKPVSIGIPRAVAKILCKRHNETLSPYDHEAAKLSRFVAKNLIDDPMANATITLDGHLLELWSLKTLVNIGYVGGLDPHTHRRLRPTDELVEFIFRKRPVTEGVGLYFISGAIDNEDYQSGLSWNVINDSAAGNVLGMSFAFCRVRFVVSIVAGRAQSKIAAMATVNAADVHYRPPNIVMASSNAGRKVIRLAW